MGGGQGVVGGLSCGGGQSSGGQGDGGVKGWGSRWVRVWLGSRGGIYI